MKHEAQVLIVVLQFVNFHWESLAYLGGTQIFSNKYHM